MIGKNGHSGRNLKGGLRTKVRGNAKRRKLRGRYSGEFLEFVYQMSLIVIAGRDRDIRPSRALPAGILRSLAETQHASEMLRAQSRALEADSAKLARAQAGSVGQFVHRNLSATFCQPRERFLHRIERSRISERRLKPSDCIARRTAARQPIEKIANRRRSPRVGEWNGLIHGHRARHAHEPRRHTRTETNAKS